MGERQDCLLGLEIIQYPLAVGVLEVVGDARERLGPVAAMTVGDLGNPAAGASVSAILLLDAAGEQRARIRLLAHW